LEYAEKPPRKILVPAARGGPLPDADMRANGASLGTRDLACTGRTARNKSGERNVVLLISAKFASAMEDKLGRALLLWLLGVPIPIIILIALLYH
jgi:hypothetical protein